MKEQAPSGLQPGTVAQRGFHSQSGDGVSHQIEVSASSIYEAAARALRAFRDEDWCSESAYKTRYLEITVKQPEVEHKLLLGRFDEWLRRVGGSPAEITQREFVKRILEGK